MHHISPVQVGHAVCDFAQPEQQLELQHRSSISQVDVLREGGVR
jgi:hypothetical protein